MANFRVCKWQLDRNIKAVKFQKHKKIIFHDTDLYCLIKLPFKCFIPCHLLFFLCTTAKCMSAAYPFIIMASSVVSPDSSGLPPKPTLPSHCSISQRAQPFSTASSTEPPDCRALQAAHTKGHSACRVTLSNIFFFGQKLAGNQFDF